MRATNSIITILVLVLAVGMQRHADARQYLISPGTEWEETAQNAKPGDEIILMPGKHLEADIAQLQGTVEQPITIRGLDVDHPALIQAARIGLHIEQPQHVVLRDLVIVGAASRGIELGEEIKQSDDKKDAETTVAEGLRYGPVQLQRVVIRQTGPEGHRHALGAARIDTLIFDTCTFDGWGGAAIDVNDCRDIEIKACIFKGRDDHSQLMGIRVDKGSDRILIEFCRFEQAAAQVIVLGDEENSTPPQTPQSAKPNKVARTLARHITVQQCLFLECGIPITITHSKFVDIRQNTMIRPQGTVVAIRDTVENKQLAPSTDNFFAYNLIVWKEGDLKHLLFVQNPTDTSPILWEENLWWSPPPTQKMVLVEQLGEIDTPQITDVDPKLDEKHQPTVEIATVFGAEADG